MYPNVEMTLRLYRTPEAVNVDVDSCHERPLTSPPIRALKYARPPAKGGFASGRRFGRGSGWMVDGRVVGIKSRRQELREQG